MVTDGFNILSNTLAVSMIMGHFMHHACRKLASTDTYAYTIHMTLKFVDVGPV